MRASALALITVEYRCSACHTAFAAQAEPHACPNCAAEAGLEAVHAPAMPMKLFGLLLAMAVIVSIAGGAAGLLGGS